MSQRNTSENEDIITLTAETGEEIDFYEVAEIPLKGHLYLILQPVVLFEGMDENEALVFSVKQAEDGTDQYVMIDPEDEITDAVFREYDRLGGYTEQ